MGFFFQVEIESALSPLEFHERVVVPLQEQLEEENVGELINDEIQSAETAEGCYELCLKVADQKRAREIVQQITQPFDKPQ